MKDDFNTHRGAPTAYVLGARVGSNNIGDHIAASLYHRHGWNVIADDGAVGDGSRPPGGNLPSDEVAREHGYNVTEQGRYQRFEAPSVDAFTRANADALVITLGRTYKDHFADVSDYEIMNMIKSNLILPLEAARRFVQAREMRRHHDSLNGIEWDDSETAHIIFLGSYAHNHPFTNGTLYCVAKTGLDMAARALGWELTDRGYRVHTVHPYHVNGTPMWAQVEQDVMKSKNMTWEEADAYNRKDLKMPDLLTPEEVAEVVTTLLTVPAMGWLSGTSVELFGGSR